MKLSSEYVGAETVKPFETEITVRRAMNYAAAVGDNNPHYLDDEREDGIVAPPMMATALTWQVAGNPAEFWPSEGFPFEVLQRQVHLTETLHWRRMMKPGDQLSLTSKILAIVPRRGGTLMVLEFLARDADGQSVFTDYGGVLLRGVKCADDGKGEEDIPKPPPQPETLTPGWEQEIPIDLLASHVFDGCADVHFPIHTSKQFARSVRLPDTILFGAATLSLAVRELVNREAAGNPRGIESVSCEFTGMVRLGTTITVRSLGAACTNGVSDVFFEVETDAGRKAISQGHVRFGTP